MGDRRVGVAAILAAVLLAGCNGGGPEVASVEPLLLELPAAASVALIQTSGEGRSSFQRSEPGDIARVLDVLDDFTAGWESTTEPIPAYVYSTSMTDRALLSRVVSLAAVRLSLDDSSGS